MFNFRKTIIIFLTISLMPNVFVAPVYAENGKEIKAIRKVLIVPRGQIERGIEMSKELGVPEVADGIPPALENKVTEDMLPYVYEEIIYNEQEEVPDETQKAMEKMGADIAEYYPVIDENIEAGDLVSVLDKKELLLNVETKYLVEKSAQPYDPKLLGVISSQSAVIINKGDAQAKPEQILRPVALVGRVPVKVNLQNGPIEIGDYLTSSNILGVAMKATERGKVIGMALEPMAEVDSQLGYGKVMVFMNIGWYDGSSATSTDVVLANGFSEKLKSIVNVVIDTITGIPKMIVNGILEVKNDVVTYGFFKGIVKVAKTVVEGRTIVVDNAASLAENSQLEVAGEDANAFSFVTYSIVSPRKEIMVSGSGKLLVGEDGKVEAKIAFHPYFSAILSEGYPIRVVVTPTTYINGNLYVVEKSIYGFTIKEINSQDAGAEFDWIVTARLTDPEKAQEVLDTTETIASQETVPDLPNSVIDSSPESTTTSTEAIFEFHSTKENSIFTCNLDADMWGGCASPKTYTDLSAGFHQFQVQAIDAQNHEEPSPSIFEWQIIAQTIVTTTDSISSPQAEPIVETSTTTDVIATSTEQ